MKKLLERGNGQMKSIKPSFQDLLQKFFLQRMMQQQNTSADTVKSYRDTFRLYIKYLKDQHHISPSAIQISHLEAEYILGFLDVLERIRKNNQKTINNRLSAIHSFLKFLAFEIPEYSALIERSRMIPFRKEEKKQMDFLSSDAFDALINACDDRNFLGSRDKLMLMLLYNTGVRVSELVGLKGKDVIKDTGTASAYIHIHAKGRKERNVPLWKKTSKYLIKYMNTNNTQNDDRLFINYTGEELTRSGIRYRIDCLVKKASCEVPSLTRKTITPHTFRHSTALHLLQAGVDISTIAIWLGHESIETTHKYMEADIEMKRRILERLDEPGNNTYYYRPDDSILTFLNSL
jgi:integrase/recombinase XerD